MKVHQKKSEFFSEKDVVKLVKRFKLLESEKMQKKKLMKLRSNKNNNGGDQEYEQENL